MTGDMSSPTSSTRPAAQRLGREMRAADAEVGVRGVLQRADGVRVELALDARPRAGRHSSSVREKTIFSDARQSVA